MEDTDKLKELFEGFQPALTSDSLFMRRLERNMEAVELVKRRSEAVRKRNKVAVAVAAVSGFLMGVILTLLSPVISNSLPTLLIKLPFFSAPAFSVSPEVPVWICIALVSAVIAYNAYVVTLSRLSAKGA